MKNFLLLWILLFTDNTELKLNQTTIQTTVNEKSIVIDIDLPFVIDSITMDFDYTKYCDDDKMFVNTGQFSKDGTLVSMGISYSKKQNFNHSVVTMVPVLDQFPDRFLIEFSAGDCIGSKIEIYSLVVWHDGFQLTLRQKKE